MKMDHKETSMLLDVLGWMVFDLVFCIEDDYELYFIILMF